MKAKGIFLVMVFLLIGTLTVMMGAKPAIAKPIELKIANFQPPLHKSNEMLENWAKLIEKETAGKVRFILYPGATLAKPAPLLRALTTILVPLYVRIVPRAFS